MPYQFSDSCTATPETIWETCFSDMKWESWDSDVQEVLEPSGGCENGTTFVFHMKSGQKILCTLQDVIKNETLTFKGPFLGGTGSFNGTIRLTPEVNTKTKIDYTFGFGGLIGPILTLAAGKAASKGTKEGLENMIRMSEEAQGKK
eukprot:CAMPEP_0194146510 /NCGR_PEP_ID=MMETSP0152-20130528/20696_1 /TAXON_ID=1049557 /ORGANISM="Thalassiothrix antarctica, Strain L6-D1" /LENGTH=145 /DNA_ID=CAMNT_0038847045 /DNA_START=35 /DNA_END=472 /DNA_ORIENTATION=+